MSKDMTKVNAIKKPESPVDGLSNRSSLVSESCFVYGGTKFVSIRFRCVLWVRKKDFARVYLVKSRLLGGKDTAGIFFLLVPCSIKGKSNS